MRYVFEILFIFLPYLKPHNITLIPALDSLFQIWKILATVLLVIKVIRKRVISKQILYILPFCGIWILSMYVNNSISQDVINGILSILGIHMYYEIYKDNYTAYSSFITTLGVLSKIYLVCQIITMIIIDGPFFCTLSDYTSDRFFLGGDNLSAFIMIVLSTIMFYADYFQYRTITKTSWIIFFLEYISLVKQFVGAAMVSFLVMFLLIVFRDNRKIQNWVTPKKAIVLSIVFVILVAFGDLADQMNSILSSVDKIGFNGRAGIWYSAFKAIQNKPLLGYGSVSNIQLMRSLLYHTNHTHNIVLEFLFETGLLGTIAFLYYLARSFQRNKPVNKILLIGISVYILNSIFDFYITSIYFYLLILLLVWNQRVNCSS